MKRKSKNKPDFNAINLVLVGIIVVLIGVVGWLVHKNHRESTATTFSTVSTNHSSAINLPSDPDYLAAKQAWINGLNSAPPEQRDFYLQAITDLNDGLTTDKNISSYSKEISNLNVMVATPETDVTPAQNSAANTAEAALNSFFDISNN